MLAFVVLGLVFSILSQEIGLGNVVTYFVSSGMQKHNQSINLGVLLLLPNDSCHLRPTTTDLIETSVRLLHNKPI